MNGTIFLSDISAGGEDILDILGSLGDIAFDIHGETGSLGDGETEVESNKAGNATQTDENTPHVIDGLSSGEFSCDDGFLVSFDDDETDDSGS